MLGTVIRKLDSVFYKHPAVAEDTPGNGAFGRLKIALVADYLTTASLAVECRVRVLTPNNYKEVISGWKPDIVFVESVFHGLDGSWRYQVAKQPRLMRWGGPVVLARLLGCAKKHGVPTLFWNKDDGAFFDAFIDAASMCDYVFTTDAACLPRYEKCLPGGKAHVLAMPYQPAFHFFSGFHFIRQQGCFVGSYYRRILGKRREFLDMLFGAAQNTGMRLNIFDRNSHRFSRYLEFSFPRNPCLRIHGGVPYSNTARIYKLHAFSLNVNSVVDSETMCSRRLLEILACGGIAVTNYSLAVKTHFSDYCHVISTQQEAEELFARLANGPSKQDKERAAAGASFVRSAHTWEHRLELAGNIVNF